MNKRGFTLIELLAVITILAIIMLIAIPGFINIIDTSKQSARRDSISLYGRAIETAVSNYFAKYPSKNDVTLEQLESENLVEYKGSKVECEVIQISKMKVYLDRCTVSGKSVDFEYGKYDPVPVLDSGLTPVIYDGNNWKVVDKDDSSWYNYDKQKWANAVTLLPGVKKEVGDEVRVDGTEASMMLVWIPRYEYKYTDLGDEYAGGTQALPGEIKVNFIGKNITESSSSEYKIHPSFTFGNKEVSGIWVGKFEMSHTTKSKGNSPYDYYASNLNCVSETCVEAQNLRILPNVPSLRYNDVSNFWYGIRAIENTSSFGLSNMDAHMMKNSEWGAVAYLSQSKYGKYGNKDYEGAQKEVYINNSSRYYTGRSGGNKGGSTPLNGTYTEQIETSQYNEYGYYTYDGYLIGYGTNNKTETRNINKGAGASTTGNIYGVYDMSGGSYEYVMGAYGTDKNPAIVNSGFISSDIFTNETINSKYYDIYANSTNLDSYDATESCNNSGTNGICYGHAISETLGWRGDYTYMVYSNRPWFVRGGTYQHDTAAGTFNYANSDGYGFVSFSARFVGIEK